MSSAPPLIGASTTLTPRGRACVREALSPSPGFPSDFPDTLAAPLDDYGAYFTFFSPQGRTPGTEGRRCKAARGDRGAHRTREPAPFHGAGLAAPPSTRSGYRNVRDARPLPCSLLPMPVSDGWCTAIQSRAEADSAASIRHRLCLLRMLRAFSAHKWSELEGLQADYVRAALLDGGGRISRIRLHLEYALGGLLDELEGSQVTDPENARVILRERLRDSLDRAASSTALVNAFRDATTLIVRTRSSPKRGPLELRLTRAARYMVEHCAEPISRASIARRVGLSPSYFSVQFKGILGLGFEEYLRRQRVERAKQLLQRSSLSVSVVGHEAGFVSVTHFNRVFRETVGETPSSHRAKFRPAALPPTQEGAALPAASNPGPGRISATRKATRSARSSAVNLRAMFSLAPAKPSGSPPRSKNKTASASDPI